MPGEVRAVLDANIFISGVIHQAGLPGQTLVAWRSGRFELITSAEINEEILDVIHRPRITEKYHIEDRIIDIGAILYTQATLVEPKHRLKVSKDPDDNKFLEAALPGNAGYLVTGDKRDLLLLNEYKGIHIVTPTEFIKILRDVS